MVKPGDNRYSFHHAPRREEKGGVTIEFAHHHLMSPTKQLGTKTTLIALRSPSEDNKLAADIIEECNKKLAQIIDGPINDLDKSIEHDDVPHNRPR